jgi:hypothetical protein
MDQHDETQRMGPRAPADETQRIDGTQRFEQASQPTVEDDRYAAPTADWPTGQPEPQRPRGPHAPTVLLGLVCLLVAGLAIARQVGGFTLDWSGYGPAVIVGAGVVLLAIGALGLVRDKR